MPEDPRRDPARCFLFRARAFARPVRATDPDRGFFLWLDHELRARTIFAADGQDRQLRPQHQGKLLAGQVLDRDDRVLTAPVDRAMRPVHAKTDTGNGSGDNLSAARATVPPDHGAAVGLRRRVEGREPVQRRSIDTGYGDIVGAASALRSRGAVVQAKLTVGRTDDPLEHEADRVADAVLRMPSPGSAGARVQRKNAPPARRMTKRRRVSSASAPPVLQS